MEQLLEDYKRKLETIKQMIADDNGESESTLERLKTKLGMTRGFIVDIERAMADANTIDSGLHLQRVRHSTPNVVNETLKQTQLDQDIKTRTKVFGMFESGDDINVSLIQRRCSVGYFSATRVLENLINDGFVEPQNNGKGLNKFL